MQSSVIIVLLSLLVHSFQADTHDESTYTIHVVQEAWHTGIVISVDDIPPTIFPELTRYSRSKYIDFGWGDEKYYQHPNPGILLGARAVLWPTSAVIRMVGFSNQLEDFYTQSTIMELTLDQEKFYDLCTFISESFMRDNAGTIIPSTIYRKSNTFFLAQRKYSVFRTCNTWAALALKEIDFDISTFFLVTANQLFRRLKKLDKARYIRER